MLVIARKKKRRLRSCMTTLVQNDRRKSRAFMNRLTLCLMLEKCAKRVSTVRRKVTVKHMEPVDGCSQKAFEA